MKLDNIDVTEKSFEIAQYIYDLAAEEFIHASGFCEKCFLEFIMGINGALSKIITEALDADPILVTFFSNLLSQDQMMHVLRNSKKNMIISPSKSIN